MNQLSSSSAPHVFPATFTPEKQDELFHELAVMYDLVDSILEAVQRPGNPNRELELRLITPFITQFTNTANILSAFYTEITRKKQPATPEIKEAMESAMRNFYIALKEVIDSMNTEFRAGDKA